MKIAIVLNTSWNIYNFRKGLIKSFINEGHEVVAIAPKDNYSDKLIEMGCDYHPISMDSRGINPIKDLSLIFELLRLYKRTKPDVILHFTVKPNIYGTLAAALLRKPVINNVCGLGTAFIKKGFVTRIVSLLYKISFRFSNKVFFQNWEDCTLFEKSGIVDPEKTDIIPGSGIDIAQFNPVSSKTNQPFTFLLVSRIIRDKGIYEYIAAIKLLRQKYPELRFQLLGQKDPCHKHGIPPEMVDQWAEAGIIEYLGTTDDVKRVIGESDCVVLPSYREGTPRTLLEAASMEKPLITTNTPGCNSVVVDGKNGLLCSKKDPQDLARAFEEMYLLPKDQRDQMGINGRKRMEENFDERFVIDGYRKALKSI